MKKVFCGVLIVLVFIACGTDRPEVDVPASAVLVLTGAALIDGTGADPLDDAVLAIDGNGEIVLVGQGEPRGIPETAVRIDAGDATILPGFINAHVHDAFSGERLEAWARAGITTVRDEAILDANAELADLIARRDSQWQDPRYARLITAGWMITAAGGYGWIGVESEAAARDFVNREIDEGADQIKVAVEDGIAGQTNRPVLPTAFLQAIVTEAHARGVPVSAHVTDSRFLETAVNCGVDDAAHATWDRAADAVFQQMIARGIIMVPTLTVFDAYGSLAGAAENVRRFATLGGTVALGNDYTAIPQNRFDHFELGMPLHEIECMSRAGMSPMQIIVAATRNAAQACGLSDELGTLATGKTADILVVKGNPLDRLDALADVRLVVHRGVIIRRE